MKSPSPHAASTAVHSPVDPLPASAGAAPMDPTALLTAMRELLQPLAQLAVGQGVLLATVEEMLKAAFVDSARAAHGKSGSDRVVSRISTVTGLNRREVTRLLQADTSVDEPSRHPRRACSRAGCPTRCGKPQRASPFPCRVKARHRALKRWRNR